MVVWRAYRARRPWAGPLTGCVLLLVASCALGSVPGAPAARGRTAPLRVLQLNLCNSGVARCYTGRAVAEAAAVLRTVRPDVVTLNEVCEDDVPVLANALERSTGGPTASAFRTVEDRRTAAAVRCRNGRLYGIGVVVRRSAAGAATVAGGVYPVQPTRGPERRAWLCLVAPDPTPGGVTACTTHLASGNPDVAAAQCAYLLGTAVPALRARSGAAPLVLGGDLNLAPGGRACVPPEDARTDDGAVQYVVATPELAVQERRTIALSATDHPGLLVTLAPALSR